MLRKWQVIIQPHSVNAFSTPCFPKNMKKLSQSFESPFDDIIPFLSFGLKVEEIRDVTSGNRSSEVHNLLKHEAQCCLEVGSFKLRQIPEISRFRDLRTCFELHWASSSQTKLHEDGDGRSSFCICLNKSSQGPLRVQAPWPCATNRQGLSKSNIAQISSHSSLKWVIVISFPTIASQTQTCQSLILHRNCRGLFLRWSRF